MAEKGMKEYGLAKKVAKDHGKQEDSPGKPPSNPRRSRENENSTKMRSRTVNKTIMIIESL